MTTLTLTPTEMRAGIWSGVVTQAGNGIPQVSVSHLGTEVAGVQLSETDSANEWLLRVPVPAEAISDGVQTFLIVDTVSGDKLGDFTVIAGEALGDDIRVEMELLRAELDMLKRAFRRHCVETA